MTDSAALAQSFDRVVRRIEARLTKNAAAFDHEKVGPLGGMVLLTLDEIAPSRIQVLVTRLSRDKSQMTRLLSLLESKGLVARAPCPNDARSTLVDLTDLGRRRVAQLKEGVTEAVTDVLRPLEPEERAALADILGKLVTD